jgi:hypothetical protein
MLGARDVFQAQAFGCGGFEMKKYLLPLEWEEYLAQHGYQRED